MTTPITPAPDELPDRYDPAGAERAIHALWDAAQPFTARAERSARVGGARAPFTIVMPPPNVTAVLHVGHALNNTVQDVLARWRRMAGDETLWLPGTDHAGIATQNVVEKLLAKEGRTRFDVGRAAFIERTACFVRETGGEILEQLRAIGSSCDWSRTAYTLSPELSRAVREAFVRLHERGLVYRGHRVIHWCPRCLTSLSDEEAEFAPEQGALYHIAYPLADDESRTITIATTRPETMLGDVAVAVHPDDDRYRDLIGRMLRLPINAQLIPVIADTYTDPAFGTGVVKITPAHDANDFEVGKRHGLPMPVVIDADARMNEGADAAGRVPEDMRGRDRFEAREQVVSRLRELKRLVRVEPHAHNVRHCYRCDTVVEPRLSDQWFVRMAPLAAPALAAVRAGELRVLPERWEAVYVNWLDGIRDWNISRQLWWGHRIPVWYCENGHATASRDDVLPACPECGRPVRQDEDVLDTWFSSWLFPLSTLGWPDENAPDLRAFYPTDVLVTAPEILFFWVARMVMAGYAFLGAAPFHSVYLHGTVRDTEHRKMSKSLGNGIDPLDVVRLYGADAMRWTLIAGMGLGTDVILDPADLDKSFAPGRNFATKLWNIGRFLLLKVGDAPVTALADLPPDRLAPDDCWILARLSEAAERCDTALGPARPAGAWTDATRTAGLRLNDYAEAARRFVWNDLADWYLETAKARLAAGGADADVARSVLVHAFDQALRLLHPIVPFITETLWQRLPGRADGALLTLAPWPAAPSLPPAYAERARLYDVVRAAAIATRQLQSTYRLSPSKRLRVLLVGDGAGASLDAAAGTLGALLRADVAAVPSLPDGGGKWLALAMDADVPARLYVMADADVAAAHESERARAEQEHAQLSKQLGALRARLANDAFVARAKAEIVDAERQKEREWTAKLAQLAERARPL